MADFYVGNNNSNPNERKELAAAASRLKMHPSSKIAERYDELVERIIPSLEKEVDEEHDKYLLFTDIKGILEANIQKAKIKVTKVRTIIDSKNNKYDPEKLNIILEKAKLNLSEKKKELADLEKSFNVSEKNHPEKVRELEAQLLKARKEAKEILKSVPAFKGGQTRARKNRAGTKRLRRR